MAEKELYYKKQQALDTYIERMQQGEILTGSERHDYDNLTHEYYELNEVGGYPGPDERADHYS